MKYLAVDVGSSFIKTALLDIDNFKIVSDRIMPQLPRENKLTDQYEIDAEMLFLAVRKLIDGYIEANRNGIDGVLLSTQMHGFVLSDTKGRPLTHYISWQDERCLRGSNNGRTHLEHLREMISRSEMKNAGVYIKPYMALCNLYAMIREGYRIILGSQFCTLGSYLIYRMTGNNICHITNAGPTGFADIVRVDWDLERIEKVGCGELCFPKITDRLESCGKYRGVDIYPDLGDHQCCVLGIQARLEKDLIVNIGTAGQLALIRNEFCCGLHESRPFFEGQYLNTFSQLPGGRNMDLVIHLLKDALGIFGMKGITDQMVWERLISGITNIDTGGLEVETSFYQSINREDGFIRRIRPNNLTVECLVSACYENIANTYAEYAKMICPSSNNLERIVFAGNLLEKIPVLRALLSEKIGLPGIQPRSKSEVFYGLFRVALVCSGRYPDLASTRKVCQNWL